MSAMILLYSDNLDLNVLTLLLTLIIIQCLYMHQSY